MLTPVAIECLGMSQGARATVRPSSAVPYLKREYATISVSSSWPFAVKTSITPR